MAEQNQIENEYDAEIVNSVPQIHNEDLNDEINDLKENEKINCLHAADETAQFHEKERELLDMVFTLESEKQSIIDESKNRIYLLRRELDDSLIENEKLKRKVTQLDQTLKQSVALGGGGPPKTKAEQDELLTRAKTLLFEKTKVCKQQETHIGTLKAQVDSIKEVLAVTKEMLNLRNTELEHMQSRLDTANLKAKAEKDKCNLIEKKLAISKNVFNNVKSEHEIQSKIFKDLKVTYEAKINALTVALGKSKENEKQMEK